MRKAEGIHWALRFHFQMKEMRKFLIAKVENQVACITVAGQEDSGTIKCLGQRPYSVSRSPRCGE
jgi:hypothetical protein